MAKLNKSVHGQWSSRLTFILAATGSAVGLGNIWKFPYMVGENGGGAFVLVYLICVAAFCIPIMMSETMMGKRGRRNPIATLGYLANEANAKQVWRLLGWLGLLAGLFILSYYSVIAGKTIAYVLKIMTGILSELTAERAQQSVHSLNSSIFALTIWHSAFIAATMYIVARGVNEGIEKAIQFLMPALFIILLLLVFYAMTTDSFGDGLAFLFSFDLSTLSGKTILLAMGQAFFTLSLGMGAIMVYGSYLPDGISIARTTTIVAIADTTVAILAGMAIFPIVFANGFTPAEGPDLIFKTLPLAFSNMFGGTLFGLMFFILLVFAALTSSISLIEPAVSFLVESHNLSRKNACIYAGVITWLLGMGTVFSTNIWSEIQFFGTTFFGFLDFLTANIMLPLGGILIAVFSGWIMSHENSADGLELSADSLIFKYWRFSVRYIAPTAVVLVLVYGFF